MNVGAHFTIQGDFKTQFPREAVVRNIQLVGGQVNQTRNGIISTRACLPERATVLRKERSNAAGPQPAMSFHLSNRKTGSSRELRVAIVDDEEDMRLFLRDTLTDAVGFTCVGCFGTASEALDTMPRLQADLVLMDIGMPEVDGIECTRLLKQANPEIKIVMVTGWHDADSVRKSLDAGADGYLTKPIVLTQFLVTLGFIAGNRDSLHVLFTPRENEILRLFARGFLYKEIAETLGISYSAVHKHQHQLFIKLHASNRTEAVENWRKLGGH